LTDLSLQLIRFDGAATPEQCQARWTDILRSVPNVRRLCAFQHSFIYFLTALSECVPLLEHLRLDNVGGMGTAAFFLQLAHPSVRQLQLIGSKISEAQVRALVRSARLPKLERVGCPHFKQ
jgi:hypothetical protein